MHRVDFWLLIARLLQIFFALIVMGFAIGLTQYDDSDSELLTCSAFLGGGVALFGVFGLFGTKRRPDDFRHAHLYLLILFIDCWAIVLSIAATICSSYYVTVYDWWGADTQATRIAPAVCAGVATLTIVPHIVRTLRLWWKRMLYTVPPSNEDQNVTYVYQSPPTQGYPQGYQMGQSSPPPRNVRPSFQNDDFKSTASSRPLSIAETTAQWSTFSGAQTLAHPNGPTRQSTTASPPYQRVEVGSKIGSL